ncbi:autoinducer binding domain-containing protein [Limimaricola pyoseonensis]|uniref:Autoinducer binding domain-containing protein n=1 Tax=Limimaricola pyoseonensis TaxID=521013 RepID=A0A1G7J2M8_9RHOB|nr:autoinducer binding domain-containing protein [Limimaricola pyoseonensis]SDF19123.1 Autoinducer binding domain-containing protein [Limimaricola pyoseonensis]
MDAGKLVIAALARLVEIAPAGFAIGLHVRFTAATYMFESYPQAWRDLYAREGMLMRDPTVLWAMHHAGAKPWEELAEIDGAGVLSRAREFGVIHGHTRSIHENGDISFGGLARSDRPFTAAEIDEIGEILQQMHDATARRQTLGTGLSARLRDMAVVMTERGTEG